jgi:hypothetical protein
MDVLQMNRMYYDEGVIRSYLLGDLDDTLREQIEEMLLCDDSFADKLSAAQDNLIDDYVYGALPDGERETFQKNFIVNEERRKKIQIAQAVEVYLAENPERLPGLGNSFWFPAQLLRRISLFLQRNKVWVAVSLTAALLLVFLAPRAIRMLIPNSRVSPLIAQRAAIEREISELNRHRSLSANVATFQVQLQPTLLREGGEIKKVVLTEDIKLVSFKLELLSGKYQVYRAIARTVEGEELFQISDLQPEPSGVPRMILLVIPTKFLSTGDYQIELKGIVANGSGADGWRYNVRIIKDTGGR